MASDILIPVLLGSRTDGLWIDIEWGTKVIDMPDESPPPVGGSVTDDQPSHRFKLSVNGETAFLVYDRTANTLTLIHTEVPAALRGHHLGDALVEAALQSARSAGLRVVAICPFAKAYIRRHPAT